MKFKHKKLEKDFYGHTGCERIRHYKYIRVWNYKDEIKYQIENGHTTYDIGYKEEYLSKLKYSKKWYNKLSSNKEINKKMSKLRKIYIEYEMRKKWIQIHLKNVCEFEEKLNNDISIMEKTL